MQYWIYCREQHLILYSHCKVPKYKAVLCAWLLNSQEKYEWHYSTVHAIFGNIIHNSMNYAALEYNQQNSFFKDTAGLLQNFARLCKTGYFTLDRILLSKWFILCCVIIYLSCEYFWLLLTWTWAGVILQMYHHILRGWPRKSESGLFKSYSDSLKSLSLSAWLSLTLLAFTWKLDSDNIVMLLLTKRLRKYSQLDC